MLEHPPQLWHNSQLSTSAQILSMIIDNWQLLPTINLLASKIRSLNSVFSSSLCLNQPSLTASYLQERVNEGRGQRFGGVAIKFCARASRAIDLAPPSFKSWIRHWDQCELQRTDAIFQSTRSIGNLTTLNNEGANKQLR